MLDLAKIYRSGMIDGKQDLGRILETMLYYDRARLIVSAQTFTGLWDLLGPTISASCSDIRPLP